MQSVITTLIMLSLSITNAVAAETIRIAWPYSSELPWHNIRTIAENANAQQNKYNFVPELKPGAGGGVAAQYALTSPNNTLISNTVTHIIRPLTTTDSGYDLDAFQPVLIQAMDIPLVMISKKYKTMSELLAQPRLNIGISAVGGITDYAARVMVVKPDTQYIGFKTGFPEQIAGVMGGHIDGAVVTLDSSKRFIDAGTVLRLADSSLSLGWTMYAPTKMDAERMREIHAILTAASNQDNVRKVLIESTPRYVYWNLARLQEWYSSERAKWTGIIAQHPLK